MEFMPGSKEEVIKYSHDNNVSIINLWFCDILGKVKSFGIPPAQLEMAFDEGLGFDGSITLFDEPGKRCVRLP